MKSATITEARAWLNVADDDPTLDDVDRMFAALRGVLSVMALCNDAQHGYSVPVSYLETELAAGLGVPHPKEEG